jgi:hypothetical protein
MWHVHKDVDGRTDLQQRQSVDKKNRKSWCMSDVNLLTFKSHYPIVTFYIYNYQIVQNILYNDFIQFKFFQLLFCKIVFTKIHHLSIN